jgi:hypothetical protein
MMTEAPALSLSLSLSLSLFPRLALLLCVGPTCVRLPGQTERETERERDRERETPSAAAPSSVSLLLLGGSGGSIVQVHDEKKPREAEREGEEVAFCR